MVWVQCMYILAPPLDIDSMDQCHNLYNTCSDLKACKISDKIESGINMNSEMSNVVQCASVVKMTTSQ